MRCQQEETMRLRENYFSKDSFERIVWFYTEGNDPEEKETWMIQGRKRRTVSAMPLRAWQEMASSGQWKLAHNNKLNSSPIVIGMNSNIQIALCFSLVSPCSIFSGCFYFLNQIGSQINSWEQGSKRNCCKLENRAERKEQCLGE